MTAFTGDQAQVLITGVALVIADEALLDSGDHTTYTVTVGNVAHRYWDDTAAFVFQTSVDGSTWLTGNVASIQYVGGKVTFTAAVTGTHQARIHAGYYLPYSALADATKADASYDADFGDSTAFTTTTSYTTWRTYVPMLTKATLKVTKWHVDQTFMDAITNATKYVVSFVVDAATGTHRVEGYARIKADAIALAVDALSTEPLEFTVTGPFYAT